MARFCDEKQTWGRSDKAYEGPEPENPPDNWLLDVILAHGV